MAKTETVVLTCDLEDDPAARVEAAATVRLVWQGATYDIEMCQGHLDAYNELLQPYVAAARPAPPQTRGSRPAANRRSTGGAGSAKRDRGEDLAIRQWGRNNGFTVGDRGRLSTALLSAYEAVHQ